jgi:hypothetical protein
MAAVPSSGSAVVVLTNGASANHLGSMLTERLLELLYDQPLRSTEEAAFGWKRAEKARSRFAERVAPVDFEEVESHLGRWEVPELGFLTLRRDGDELVASWGEMESPLMRAIEGPYVKENGYYITRGPLKSLPIRLAIRADEPVVILGEGAVEYTFTRVETP